MACRDIARAQRAADEIKEISGNRLVEVEYLDLADLDTVRTFAAQMNEKLDRLDILVNNAGLMQIPYWKTAQGFEMQFGVNHLGHFLLTNLLVDLMKKANSARIINVSSLTHASKYIKCFIKQIDLCMTNQRRSNQMGRYQLTKELYSV